MQAGVRSVVLTDAFVPAFAARSVVRRVAVEGALMLGFASLVAVCAQIAVRLPWTTVPITGQTFGVLVAGGALGARRGAGALLVYVAMGILSIPVFAPNLGSLSLEGDWALHLVLPWRGTSGAPWELSSGGYLLGFVLAAAVAGHFARLGWDRRPWGLLSMLLGNALIYVPGLLWLSYLLSVGWVPPGATMPLGAYISGSGTWDKTLRGGLYPFIIGDLMKLYLAFITLPTAWALVRRFRGDDSRA